VYAMWEIRRKEQKFVEANAGASDRIYAALVF
jgi:hypothetical protein